MTFKVYGEIEIDGKKARVEIKGVDDALQKAAGGAEKFTFAGKGAAGGMGKLKGETTLAAGSVATLGAQFNDIGVMLAAGQNPLQLAIQQGTQITQVFGNAGAAARVGMLKAALASVISPANLLTIGLIAGGAALARWGMNALSAGEGADDLVEKIEAVEERIRSLRGEVRSLELGVSDDELTLLDAIATSRERVADLQNQVNTADVESVLFVQQRLQAERDNLAALQGQLSELRDLSSTQEQLTAAKRDEAAARAELRDLLGEAEVNRMIALYGEDSLAVTRARLQVARDLKVEEYQSMEITTEKKLQLLAAWDAANGIASVDLAGNITLAANEAGRLYMNLADALSLSPEVRARKVRAGIADGSIPPWAANDLPQTDGERAWERILDDRRREARRPTRPGRGGRTGGGGASAADREREAVDTLIQSLQEQLDLVRETDPVQKEMIRNRDALKAATDAERASVEELIATRIAEEAAIESAAERAQFFRDTAYDALEGLILRGEKGADVIANLADALADAALQSALLGEGPLAGLFGTSDSGGLFGIIASAFTGDTATPGKADGGMIYGAGGPRDDLKHVRVSPGEFIVNASATAQNRALLEHINGGGLLGGGGFAQGGIPIPVPMQGGAQGGAGGMGRVVIALEPSRMFDARILEVSEGVMIEGLEDYRSNTLPGDVGRISQDPGRIG